MCLRWLPARWLPPLLVVLVTFVAFLPTLRNEFVNWDDPANLVDNPHYRGLGWPQLRWMFTTFHMGHYIPLTWVTLGVDYLLWGMNPRGYHLTNLLLHIATAVVFYFVTLRLLKLAVSGASDAGTRLASGFAALVFAIHPLRVESVAWATERRDALSGLFFLLTILAYLRACAVGHAGPARTRWLAVSTGVFGLAVLSKAIVVTLPVILLALDFYPLRRLRASVRGVWAEKVPFLLLAFAGGLVTLMARIREAPMAPLQEHGVTARLAQAMFGLTFYLWKTVVPLDLSPFYPLPVPLNPLAPSFVLSGAVVLGITIAVLALRRRFPAGLVAWVSYGALLSPVLGITQQGEQIVADRYSYLSCQGWAVLAGAGLLAAWRARERFRIARPVVTLALAGLVVGALGTLTWQQVTVWHDSIRLWTHALRLSPGSFLVHSKLAVALHREARLSEAVQHYRHSLELEPRQPSAHSNLGHALARQGKLAQAIDHFQHALRMNPLEPDAHYGLGNIRLRQGRYAEAADHFRRALEARPTFAEAYNNLGVALAEQGRFAEAVAAYRQALRVRPGNANAHNNLGNALLNQGRPADAIVSYQEALRLHPKYPSPHFGLGLAYLQLNDRSMAMKEYRRLKELDGELADRLLSLITR